MPDHDFRVEGFLVLKHDVDNMTAAAILLHSRRVSFFWDDNVIFVWQKVGLEWRLPYLNLMAIPVTPSCINLHNRSSSPE